MPEMLMAVGEAYWRWIVAFNRSIDAPEVFKLMRQMVVLKASAKLLSKCFFKDTIPSEAHMGFKHRFLCMIGDGRAHAYGEQEQTNGVGNEGRPSGLRSGERSRPSCGHSSRISSPIRPSCVDNGLHQGDETRTHCFRALRLVNAVGGSGRLITPKMFRGSDVISLDLGRLSGLHELRPDMDRRSTASW